MKIRSLQQSFGLSKRWVLAAVVLAGTMAVEAMPLLPGGALFPAPSEPDPIGGSVLQTIVTPFSSATLSGILTSRVVQGDSGNTNGGLTFTYQISLSLNSPNGVSQLSISRFGSFLTDASYFTIVGDTAPSFISRSNEGGGRGDVIQFHFGAPLPVESLLPGHTSDLLVVQTSSQNYQLTTASIIDGVAVPNIASLAPLAVPEPGVAALALIGMGIAGYRRLSRRNT
jgi:hypothetical protein